MPISDYDHWNEEAAIIYFAENDFDSPYADDTDDEIKRRIYEMDSDEFDRWCDEQ